MTTKEAIQKLNELELQEFAYGHAMGILSYDDETVAPRNSRIPRGKTMGVLSELSYKLSTGDEAMKLLDYLKEHTGDLSPEDRRRVEIRDKRTREMKAIPLEEYVAYSELLNEASNVWREAKNRSDYKMFEPYLGRIIDAQKRFAGYVAPDMDPYDYCLDQYEEGLTQQRCEEFFATLRARIVPLLEKVKAAGPVDTSFLSTPFPVSDQRELSAKLMEIMGLPRESCIIGEVEHPFTTGFSKYDVRITTHYYENAFLSSMYSVIHEGGHALYDLHSDDRFCFTSLEGGVSMGVHESQSRFYENIIGRSREFVGLIYPEIIRLCPKLAAHGVEELWRAANVAEPSLIRTEADELTYPLHIMVRYEMEKAMIRGDVNTAQLPEMWNALYREYLGIDVPDDKNGILQDSHWSGGGIGYFPSYALGSAYGAQLLAKMREDLDVNRAVRENRLSDVNRWLEEKIWKYGSLYKPAELMERAFGGPFDPTYYTDYLERKYTEVYKL